MQKSLLVLFERPSESLQLQAWNPRILTYADVESADKEGPPCPEQYVGTESGSLA